ncbi:MAG: ParB/RepB/Spo0J family partition protein [Eubacteriales bacterium]
MNQKHGLGAGLNMLLGDLGEEEPTGGSTVPLMKVQPGLNQPRKNFDPESITELAESIRIHGVIQPLTVRLLDSGYYEIVAGERRWRAAKEAELTEIPVQIIEADDRKVMEIGLIENLQREDLNPLEEARGYQLLMEEYHLTQEEVSQRMGKSRPAIANSLRLLGLPESLLPYLESAQLSAGHARAILVAPNQRVMEEVAEMVMKNDLSVRRTEALMRQMKEDKPVKKKSFPDDANDVQLYVRESQENLSQALGRRVLIQHRGKKGKIVLEYTDAQDLTGLVEVLATLQEEQHGV